MLYPTPTVWSAHVMIALDENGQILLNAMQDEEVQDLAWKKHGFRTGNYGDIADSGAIPGGGSRRFPSLRWRRCRLTT